MIKLKNNVLLILLMSAIAFCAQGQNNKLELGFEGGCSLISLRGNDILSVSSHPRIALVGGFSLQYNFNKKFSLRTNISFERKGAALKEIILEYYPYTGVNFTGNVNLDYLTMPFLFRATFGKKIRYFANGGPFVSFLIRETNIERPANMPKMVSVHTSDYKKLDAGLTLGVGLSIPLKEHLVISLELRNNLGLINVYAIPQPDSYSIGTNSTNVLMGIAYKF